MVLAQPGAGDSSSCSPKPAGSALRRTCWMRRPRSCRRPAGRRCRPRYY